MTQTVQRASQPAIQSNVLFARGTRAAGRFALPPRKRTLARGSSACCQPLTQEGAAAECLSSSPHQKVGSHPATSWKHTLESAIRQLNTNIMAKQPSLPSLAKQLHGIFSPSPFPEKIELPVALRLQKQGGSTQLLLQAKEVRNSVGCFKKNGVQVCPSIH